MKRLHFLDVYLKVMWRKRLEIKDEKERIIKDYKKAKERTMNRAVRLLAAKPRSVKELRERLLEKEWTNGAIVDEVLKKLEEYKYLDDEQFAEGFAAALIVQLHRQTDDVMTLLGEQGRGDR